LKTVVYLVRHAEVENPDDIEYMRLPGFGLSDFGRKQAEELSLYFKDKNISKIYSSPLLRTRETAQIIAGAAKVTYCKEFTEANFKKWQGLRRSDRPKAEVEGYYKNPVKYSAILGESLSDIQKRVNKKLFRIVEDHQGENILIVTHASPLVVMMLFFENKPLSYFSKTLVNYGGIATITLDSQLQCRGVHYEDYVTQREEQDE
jgi:probable phosphoglycerate mutase